jgi:ubiquinol-cytochrome c reductase cytochrome c1 subunit
MKSSRMSFAKALLMLSLALPVSAAIAAEESIKVDHAPVNINDNESLQRGARLFVNYCLTCHSANYMRYSRMQDIGLTEPEIKDNLLFASDKVGDTMHVSMEPKLAKAWFGAPPPDLTVITRSRGADWVYTYLRSFYRDESRPTGWNNTAFDKVAMPNVLHELQGEKVPVYRTEKSEEGKDVQVIDHLELAKPGKMTSAEYDGAVADLVNYLYWMGEPAHNQRLHMGLIVVLFLSAFAVLAFYLKKEFWKDVH